MLSGDAGRSAGWSWDGFDPERLDGSTLDGVAVEPVAVESDGETPAHPNLIDRVDHLVVATPDIDRTIGRYEEAGLDLRRTRTLGEGRDRRIQAFFWAGDLILELVGPAAPSGSGPSALWGISFTSSDLDATIAELGPDRIGSPRDAVQSGRRIATLRTREGGISLPLAVMSPHSATDCAHPE